eukprot:120777_1
MAVQGSWVCDDCFYENSKAHPLKCLMCDSPNPKSPSKSKKENASPSPVKTAKSNGKSKKRSVEEVYQKKTPREHVLLRPDTYIGSTQSETKTMWVFDESTDKMIERQVKVIPGLHKIFDEILVNAADNKQRDKSMNMIKVDFDEKDGQITVWNNGKGIPITMHKKHNCYVPELIFGHMLTSSNFDDDEKRVVGGRNGYGAKLTNIFSKSFIIETCDGKKKFRQRFTNNMTKIHEPRIVPCKTKNQYTKIIFRPDFRKFGLDGFDRDTLALLKKRVYDMAGVTDKSVRVKLNGETISINCFKDYLRLFTSEDMQIQYLNVSDRWEVGVCMSTGHFQQVSYVNSICTSSGGRHVDHVTDKIVNYFLGIIKKKQKAGGHGIKKNLVKDFLFVFVNSLIENPAFKSQTKEDMVTKVKDFGSACDLPESFLKKVEKSCKIVEEVMAMAKHKASRQLARQTDGSKTSKLSGIPKLDDANDAGTRHSAECTLILTEGDSAKSLAVSGLSVIGRDRYGVFPLRGKLLNVRDAGHKQIKDNKEIANLKKIIGLRDSVDYSNERNFKQLRYGRVMIMTDQDHDGSHIKGLLVNLFHHYWPSLLKKPGFLLEFITPIVVCTRARAPKTVERFYTLPEYEAWKRRHEHEKGWSIKYYKGLGTSTTAEAKIYFSKLARHRIKFAYRGSACDDSIELAFAKKNIERRKLWLADYEPGTFLDMNVNYISYRDFVHKELILYSVADNVRSIPSMVDGLKPGQRKVLFSAFKRNMKKEMKVVQFAGYVGEMAAYHHGEAALHATIIKMAQNFVGSNNVNLLYPAGQFGSRAMGGSDASSPRYIFTRLCPVARALFPKDDDGVLNYLDDDGIVVEPEYYVPIIPMVLVNGADGIGTGWSTSVPCFNPRDLVRNIRLMIDGQEPQPVHPWFKGWTGTLRQTPDNNYAMVGKFELLSEYSACITELPVRVWTDNYKNFLETLMQKEVIEDIRMHHADNTVSFTITTTKNHPMEEVSEHLLKSFRLTGKVQSGNMVLFDREGKLKRYSSANQVLKEFFDIRIEFYEKRKKLLVKNLEEAVAKLNNRVRFIKAIVKGEFSLNNKPKRAVLKYLRDEGYQRFEKTEKKAHQVERPAEPSSDDEEGSDNEGGDGIDPKDERGYDYLLSAKLWSLTKERVRKLKEECARKEAELTELKATTIRTMYRRDLDSFEDALNAHDIDEEKTRAKTKKLSSREKERAKDRAKKNIRKKKKKKGDDGKDVKAAKAGYFVPKKNDGKSEMYRKLMFGETWETYDVKKAEKSKAPRGRKRKANGTVTALDSTTATPSVSTTSTPITSAPTSRASSAEPLVKKENKKKKAAAPPKKKRKKEEWDSDASDSESEGSFGSDSDDSDDAPLVFGGGTTSRPSSRLGRASSSPAALTESEIMNEFGEKYGSLKVRLAIREVTKKGLKMTSDSIRSHIPGAGGSLSYIPSALTPSKLNGASAALSSDLSSEVTAPAAKRFKTEDTKSERSVTSKSSASKILMPKKSKVVMSCESSKTSQSSETFEMFANENEPQNGSDPPEIVKKSENPKKSEKPKKSATFMVDSDDEEEFEEVIQPRARASRRNTGKRANYVEESEEEEEEKAATKEEAMSFEGGASDYSAFGESDDHSGSEFSG